jgi:hypothetical protein
MKKKIFNKVNTSRGGSTSPGYWIRIHLTGTITFSRAVSTEIIKEGGFNLVQDEDRPQDWYIEISDSEHAFKLRLKKANNWDKTSVIQNAAMARAILSSCDIEKSARFLVSANEAEGMYAILTKSATVKKKAA